MVKNGMENESEELGQKVKSPSLLIGRKGKITVTLAGKFWQQPEITPLLDGLYNFVLPHNPVTIRVRPLAVLGNSQHGMFLRMDCE